MYYLGHTYVLYGAPCAYSMYSRGAQQTRKKPEIDSFNKLARDSSLSNNQTSADVTRYWVFVQSIRSPSQWGDSDPCAPDELQAILSSPPGEARRGTLEGQIHGTPAGVGKGQEGALTIQSKIQDYTNTALAH